MAAKRPPNQKNESILNFFSKVPRPSDKDEREAGVAQPQPAEVDETTKDTSVSAGRSTAQCLPANDIGHAVNSGSLTDKDRMKFLKPWKPEKDCDFPSSIHTKSNKERVRRLLPHHLNSFPWLAVSKVEGQKGAFCLPCVLFMSSHGVGGRSSGHGQTAGRLVTKPLERFDDLTGKQGALSLHETKEYHRSCVLAMEDFKHVMLNKESDIRTQIDQAREKEIEQNRACLKPMVDTVLTLARQNVALRGHYGEVGCIDPNNSIYSINVYIITFLDKTIWLQKDHRIKKMRAY